jgi:type IV pilus assembly protein PilF
MISKYGKTGAGRVVCCSLIGLLFGVGCVTSSGKFAEETRLKKAKSHYNLGIDYLGTDRIALGLRELLLAEDLDPKDASIQRALGDGYLMRGKHQDAEQHYLRGLELAPDFHAARLNLAGLYNQLSRYEESIAHSKVLAEDATFPAPSRALANQGWAELQLGRIDDARRSLEFGLDFDPGYWPVLLNLGILEMEQGRNREAIALFQKVLERRPGSEPQSEANYRLGEIYIALGERKRAISHLMAALADAPGGRWGIKSEEYLNLLR